MSDKFYNAYVESAIGILQEYISIIVQLKAQLKVSSDTLAEKEKTIVEMSSEIEAIKNQNNEMHKLQSDAKQWENSYHGMLTKVSHMDTLTKQYNDLKKQFLVKCEELDAANLKIKELESGTKSSKKVINSKIVEPKSKETDVDDF